MTRKGAQTWNKPKLTKVDGCPTNLVTLTKKVYDIETRPKGYAANKWDCCPLLSRRKIQPDRRTNLRKKVLNINLAKKEAANLAVALATNDVQRKKAINANEI